MAIYGKALRNKHAADAAYDRELAGIRRVTEWVETPFVWQSKQTATHVTFSAYGTFRRDQVAWRKADGTVVPWSAGRQGDTFLISRAAIAHAETST